MIFEEEYMYNWIHDDITWCGNECCNTSCERNLANRLNKEGLFSMALLKGTPACPLYKEESYPTDNKKNTRKVNGE